MRQGSIVIFGVCHTAATVNETLAALERFPFSRDTLVFVEPRKRILEGIERCDDRNIMVFFRKVVDFLMSRGAQVVPLNPMFSPSHSNTSLFRKIACQFAEEEYMVDVIASSAAPGQNVVIIGDIHAERMRDLLVAKGFKVVYHRLSCKTPSDVVVTSWREALLGRARSFISLRWLDSCRRHLRERMHLPVRSRIPMIFYGNERLYHKYLEEAQSMEVRGEINRQGFMVDCDSRFIRDAEAIKQRALRQLRMSKRPGDHSVVRDNRIR